MLRFRTRQVCTSVAGVAAPLPACHSRHHVHTRYRPQQSMAAPLVSMRQAKITQNMRSEALSLDHAALSNGNGTAQKQRPLKVLIAGAGIGGLVLAVALLKRGCDVSVYERDMTAIRGEGKYRGPIQVRELTSLTAQRHRTWHQLSFCMMHTLEHTGQEPSLLQRDVLLLCIECRI